MISLQYPHIYINYENTILKIHVRNIVNSYYTYSTHGYFSFFLCEKRDLQIQVHDIMSLDNLK